jgi:hypothetical protein
VFLEDERALAQPGSEGGEIIGLLSVVFLYVLMVL